jgi:CheY-like chemotaxis protein
MQNAVEPLRFVKKLVKKSVLIADDDREMRCMLGELFRRAGFDVIEVSDGRELVSRFRRMSRAERPHLVVVTDIDMPGMSGLEALRQIRLRRPDAHVIVVTSFADDSTRKRASQLGASAVFNKPVDVGLLCDTALLLAGD